jgi:Putative zinc-finger
VTRHLGVEALALYLEGQLSRRKAARVAAHLSRCSRCAKIEAGLRLVPSKLASQPAPMPPQLAARVQMAIAAEAASRASTAAKVSEAGPGRARAARHARPAQAGGTRSGRSGWRAMPVTLATATAAVVVLVIGWGVYAIVSVLGSGLPGPAAVPAARSPLKAVPHVGRPPATFTITVPAGDGKSRTTQVITSAANFTSKTLAAHVRRDMMLSLRGRPQAGPESTSSGASSTSQSAAAALTSCVAAVAHGRPVLLVELARYLGSPATFIITGNPATSSTLVVTVVARTCSAAEPHVIARITVPASRR